MHLLPTTSPLPRSAAPTCLVAICLAATCLASPAGATVWYVSPCGSDAWVGVTQVCSAPLGPKRTVQAAIDVASDGDEIRVLPGTYAGTIDLDGKAVHLRGLGGPMVTVIDGDGDGPVVLCNSFEGSDTIIEGLTITGGATSGDGGGMLITLSSPSIVDCRIVGNTADGRGGGVACFLASPTFVACTIQGNHADDGGGGAYTSFGNPAFSVSSVQFNSSGFHGGGLATSGGQPSIVACSIVGNSAAFGAGVHHDVGSLTIDSCLVAGNDALFDGGGVMVVDADLTMEDTELEQNAAGDSGGALAALGGTIELVDVDMTMNEAKFGGGASATNGAEVTMVGCLVQENDASASSGGLSFVDASVSLVGCTLAGNTGGSVGALGVARGELGAVGVSFVDNAGGWLGGAVGLSGTSADDTSFSLCGFSGNLGGIAGGAFAIADAGVLIQSSVLHDNHAASGGAIAVLTQSLGGGVALPVAVRGCAISGNAAVGAGGAVALESGAWFLATNSQFLGNVAGGWSGGAIDAAAAMVVLSRCDLIGNSAPAGGAAEVRGGTLLCSNSVLAKNVADEEGGALRLFNLVGSHIGNCTIADNDAGAGGGAMDVHGSPDLAITNSILWGNQAPTVTGSNLPQAVHSIAPATVAGPGSFLANPLFVDPADDDYRTGPASPAVDVGLLSLLPADVGDADGDGDVTEWVQIDRDGLPRVMTSAAASELPCALTLDMGAHEVAGLASDALPGDLNGDGVVGSADLGLLLAAWGPTTGCPAADFNGDGVVDGADLAMVLVLWTEA